MGQQWWEPIKGRIIHHGRLQAGPSSQCPEPAYKCKQEAEKGLWKEANPPPWGGRGGASQVCSTALAIPISCLMPGPCLGGTGALPFHSCRARGWLWQPAQDASLKHNPLAMPPHTLTHTHTPPYSRLLGNSSLVPVFQLAASPALPEPLWAPSLPFLGWTLPLPGGASPAPRAGIQPFPSLQLTAKVALPALELPRWAIEGPAAGLPGGVQD